MKIRWLAAGVTGLLIIGGTMTVAQRVITQKTRGVLPEANDSAHLDSRRPLLAMGKPAAEATPAPPAVVAVAGPPEPPLDLPAAEPPIPPPATITPTVAVIEPTPSPASPPDEAPPPRPAPEAVAVAGDAPPTPHPAESGPTDPAVSPAHAAAPPPQANPGPRDVLSDPVQSVESFVEQNRREADQAIQALTAEASNLKTRLDKVEVALARWQTFARALNVDMPPIGTPSATIAPATETASAPPRPETGLAEPRARAIRATRRGPPARTRDPVAARPDGDPRPDRNPARADASAARLADPRLRRRAEAGRGPRIPAGRPTGAIGRPRSRARPDPQLRGPPLNRWQAICDPATRPHRPGVGPNRWIGSRAYEPGGADQTDERHG